MKKIVSFLFLCCNVYVLHRSLYAIKDYLKWVLTPKGKGREIRCINGKYYLYLVHTERFEGKVKKSTNKY